MGGGDGRFEVGGVQDVVQVALVVGFGLAGVIVLPITVGDELGEGSSVQSCPLPSADGHGVPCRRPCPRRWGG